MTYAFALILAGGVALMSGVRNRPILDILRGITSAVPGPGSGFLVGPPRGQGGGVNRASGPPPGMTGPVGTEPGPPDWGGAAAIFAQVITPFVAGRGLSAGASKEEGHAKGGDHDPASSLSYAVDYPASEQAAIAVGRELAEYLGDDKWRPNSYRSFTATVGGLRVRFQILAGAKIDHDDHLHVGGRVLGKAKR